MTTTECLSKLPALVRSKPIANLLGVSRGWLIRNASACVVHVSPGGTRYYSRDKLISFVQGMHMVAGVEPNNPPAQTKQAGTPRHRNGMAVP